MDQPVTRSEYIAGLAHVALLVGHLLNAAHRDLADRIADTVVEVKVGGSTGTGVVVAPGQVITNAHVVGNSATALVRWTHPRTVMRRVFSAPHAVLRRNAGLDLALVEVPDATEQAEIDPDWVSTDLAAVDRDHDGELLFTYGSPLGYSGVWSAGHFSGHRFVAGGLFLTYSGGINPGNSGGPLFNMDGRLVGLVARKPLVSDGSGDHDPADNLAFAIPALTIQAFLSGEV